MRKLRAYLVLMRPANLVTALADILAGLTTAGISSSLWLVEDAESSYLIWMKMGFLLLSTLGLYGGGVVFNDVFDADLDRKERPERPIPSGIVGRWEGALLGLTLLVFGITMASMVSPLSGAIAIMVAILALIYDLAGKHHRILGPINMGACRGGNLLLGVSFSTEMFLQHIWLMLIPMVYIGAITLISQGEVHGNNRPSLRIALFLYMSVIILLLSIGIWAAFDWRYTLPFVIFLSYRIFPPLLAAIRTPQPLLIRSAVKSGVLSLIVLDACLAAGFGGWIWGVIVLILLPFSLALAKVFAVT